MGMPGAVARLEPPFPSQPRRDLPGLAGRSAPGSAGSSAQGQSLAGPVPGQAELGSPGPNIRVLPSQMSPGVLEPLLGGLVPCLLIPLAQHLSPLSPCS